MIRTLASVAPLLVGVAILLTGQGLQGTLLPVRANLEGFSKSGVPETFVATGHRNGLVTINVLEADEVQRVSQRELSSERYRSLLGHFRHEAGHYYYFQLIFHLN